jgi:hypothetical protein
MTFAKVMFLMVGMILICRFVNSFEGKDGKSYSARKLVLNSVTFFLYILSIPAIW